MPGPNSSIYSRYATFYPDGQPMPENMPEHTDEWVRVADPEKPEQWVVAQNYVGRVWLSTVWLGEIVGTFETALFRVGDAGADLLDVLTRWDDWYNALRGHHLFLAELQLRFALPRYRLPRDLAGPAAGRVL